MNNKLYISIISFLVCYSFIAYCHNTVDTADENKKEYLFSESVDGTLEKYDPIAFKQALDKFGPLNKHARILINVLLNYILLLELEETVNNNARDAVVKINAMYAGQMMGPLMLTIFGGIFTFSNGIDWWRGQNSNGPASCANAPRGSLYSTMVSAAVALYGYYCLIQEGLRAGKERKQIEQAAVAELKSKKEAILSMIKIVSEHPGQESA